MKEKLEKEQWIRSLKKSVPQKDKCCKTLIEKIDIKPAKGLREVKETKQQIKKYGIKK
jgi:hypothetical protein